MKKACLYNIRYSEVIRFMSFWVSVHEPIQIHSGYIIWSAWSKKEVWSELKFGVSKVDGRFLNYFNLYQPISIYFNLFQPISIYFNMFHFPKNKSLLLNQINHKLDINHFKKIHQKKGGLYVIFIRVGQIEFPSEKLHISLWY
jgi:hypothetical protein